MVQKSPNDNHPKLGASIKVEPIRELKAIKRIKYILADNPRDLCLFTMGINTAYRANELLSLTVGQVDHLVAGDRLDLKQTKNKKYRPVTMNAATISVIDAWLKEHPDLVPDAPLFRSQKKGTALEVSTLSKMVKKWCADVGLKGNYASHTLRKTWGYHQRVTYSNATAVSGGDKLVHGSGGI
jgi:integrase